MSDRDPGRSSTGLSGSPERGMGGGKKTVLSSDEGDADVLSGVT
jgi:hypothetical protein